MRTFMFRDVIDTLATTEKANFLVVRARNRKSAIQEVELALNANTLTFFGKVFFTAATFTTGSKTLTLSNAFTRYAFANSTRIIITGGTGVTTGEYVIASRSSNSTIVLTAEIAGGGSPTDVAGYIIGGRTMTPIERTYDNAMAAFPGTAKGTDGADLLKGVAPGDNMRGILYEQYAAAT